MALALALKVKSLALALALRVVALTPSLLPLYVISCTLYMFIDTWQINSLSLSLSLSILIYKAPYGRNFTGLEFSTLESWSQDVLRPYFLSLRLGVKATTCKAKAKAKDLTFKAKAKAKDLIPEDKVGYQNKY